MGKKKSQKKPATAEATEAAPAPTQNATTV